MVRLLSAKASALLYATPPPASAALWPTIPRKRRGSELEGRARGGGEAGEGGIGWRGRREGQGRQGDIARGLPSFIRPFSDE